MGDEIPSWQVAVSELRREIEQLGVMAVINGVVGNNTSRRLSVEEFRGFALTDPYAPLIFVNGADAKSAQMFTLAHELAHVWLGSAGVSGFDGLYPGGTEMEDWCNRTAAEFLSPAQEVRARWAEVRRREALRGAPEDRPPGNQVSSPGRRHGGFRRGQGGSDLPTPPLPAPRPWGCPGSRPPVPGRCAPAHTQAAARGWR